jgi:class 3 adenylate cyclase
VPGPAVISLESWLGQLAEESGRAANRLVVGGTGHLLLDPREQDNVIRHLESGVLPRLLQPDSQVEVIVIAGLAPGSDLLLMRTIVRWLRQHRIRHRMLGLLPVSPELLIEDWQKKLSGDGVVIKSGEAEHLRQDMQQLMRECHQLVDMVPASAAWRMQRDPAARQFQYRRLAAVLAEFSDVLIAVLREQSVEFQGGTAEVVRWRLHSGQIPAEFADLRRAWHPGEVRRQLIVIDPAVAFVNAPPAQVSDPAEGVALRARATLKAGNYLLCYDIVARARLRGIDSRDLQYLTILALANAGNTRLALRRHVEFERSVTGALGEDWLALKGRLLKDLAFRGGSDEVLLFQQSAGVYEAAFQRTGGSFSGINAASMRCLGGDRAGASALARTLLQQLDRQPPKGDEEEYFWHVSRAEAALLMGDVATCRTELQAANGRQLSNVNARSRTRTQLRRLSDELGQEPGLAAMLSLPPVIYVSRPGSAEAWLPRRQEPWVQAPLVFIGLVGPRALRIAEQYLDQGALLYAVLASERASELHRWRQRYGDELGERFARCVRRAHEVAAAHGFLADEQDWCMRYVESMARGLSMLAARRLATEWLQVPGPGEGGGADAAGLAAAGDAETGSAGEHFSRRYVGLIFADFVGFSALSDSLLPIYWQRVMGAVAAAMQVGPDKILFRHTWGDAVHVITHDAASAADVATRIRAALERLRPELPPEMATLELRLSIHYAPVFVGQDPVEGAPTYFGSQLSFTARIEPVTPAGAIFVTESFAAQVMLEAPDQYVLDYAGELELAKNYGKYRLFSLRKSG